MEKKKVNELATDLNMDVKDLVALIKEIGIAGKSAKSKLEENELDVIFEAVTTKIAVASIEEIMKEDDAKKAAEKKPEAKEKKAEKKSSEKASEPAKKAADKPKKAEMPAAQEKKEPKKSQAEMDKELNEVIEKPIEKKVRYVDTRSSNVDLDKFNDEKIQDILKTDDIYGTHDKKQKLKKGGQQQSKKFEKFDHKAKKQTIIKPEVLNIKIPDEITVGELAQRLKNAGFDVDETTTDAKILGGAVCQNLK